ncbi:hypothetical protein CHUAL_002972 [Chamberlinius hualienensis]
MKDLIFGGIEGGATRSKVVLVKGDGTILCQLEDNDMCTSHWLVGMKECRRRLNDLLQRAKSKCKLDPDTPIKGLGLSLSGCEQEKTNEELKSGFRDEYPNLSENYSVVSDTVGSIVTVNPNGGIVLISGTGSNCLLLNPDGSTHRCGGWGYILGDEGSSYFLALRAVKMVIDESDNFIQPPHDITVLRRIVFDHFQLKDRFGILEHAYGNFEKANFASLTKKIAKVVAEENDPLCAELFRETGVYLGKHVAAIASQIHPKLIEQPGGVPIACVGAVWLSWDFLKEGFLQGIKKQTGEYFLHEFTLYRPITTLALGAAYLGAKEAGHVLPLDWTKNSQSFFHWKLPPEEVNGANGV